MRVKYGYLDEQFADFDSYVDELREWVLSGEYTLGPWVERFETKFAEYLGVKHCIGSNTGTDALMLALQASGIQPGDEVITVANTFYATAGAIVGIGAKPVFVDCDERFQMDASLLEAAITEQTKGIVPVWWGGCAPDMDAVLEIATKHNLVVVEDSCPGVGANINGKPAGTFGKVNAFSMHPLKPLNVWGDGGMVVTNDDKAAEWLRLYHNHGLVDREHIAFWGVNKRLQPLQALVGARVLDTIDAAADIRIRNAQRLDKGLSKLEPHVRVPARPAGHREVYQLYMVSVERRDELLAHLQGNEIEARVHYPIALHLQAPGRELGYKEGDFPIAERQAQELITLPAHQFTTLEQMDFVVEKIAEFYS